MKIKPYAVADLGKGLNNNVSNELLDKGESPDLSDISFGTIGSIKKAPGYVVDSVIGETKDNNNAQTGTTIYTIFESATAASTKRAGQTFKLGGGLTNVVSIDLSMCRSYTTYGYARVELWNISAGVPSTLIDYVDFNTDDFPALFSVEGDTVDEANMVSKRIYFSGPVLVTAASTYAIVIKCNNTSQMLKVATAAGTMANGNYLSYASSTWSAVAGEDLHVFANYYSALVGTVAADQTQTNAGLILLDQSQTTTDADFILGTGSSTAKGVAQSFKTGQTNTGINRVVFKLYKSGGTDGNLICEIKSSLEGAALGSCTVAVSTLAGASAEVNFDFPTPVEVTPNTTYYAVLRKAADSSSTSVYVAYNTAGGYADGSMYYSLQDSPSFYGGYSASKQMDINFSADNFLDLSVPTTNWGTTTFIRLMIQGGIDEKRGLIKAPLTFDPTISISITSTVLWMYCYAIGNARSVKVERVLLDWHETQSTWTIYSTGNNWNTAGCGGSGTDYITTNSVTTSIFTASNWYSWDISTIAAGWYAGSYSNYGLRVTQLGTNPEMSFVSREGANIPYFRVTAPGGANLASYDLYFKVYEACASFAQIFKTSGATTSVPQVDLYLSKNTGITSGTYTVSLVGVTAGGQPDPLNVLASKQLNLADLPDIGSETWVAVSFSPTPTVVISTDYAIIISVDSGEALLNVFGENTGTYALGELWIKYSGAWTITNSDMAFKSYKIGNYPVFSLFSMILDDGTKKLISVCNSDLHTQSTKGGAWTALSVAGMGTNKLVDGVLCPDQKLYFVDGTVSKTYDGTNHADMGGTTPPNCELLAFHDNRLFLGKDSEKRWIYISDLLEFSTYQIVNIIKLPGQEGDTLTGMVSFGRTLVMGMQNSLWVLDSSNTAILGWVLYKSKSPVGCVAGRTMKIVRFPWGDRLLHLAADGLYAFDGLSSEDEAVFRKDKNRPTTISDPITATINSINQDYIHTSYAIYDPADLIYYLAVPTGSSSVPNVCIALDCKRMAFSILTIDAMYQQAYHRYSGVVYDRYGAPATSPFIYRFESDKYEYAGRAIPAYYFTKAIDFKGPDFYKRVQDILLRISSFNQGWKLYMNYYINEESTPTNSDPIEINSSVDTSESIKEVAININQSARIIKFEFYNDVIGEQFELHYYMINASLKKRIAKTY